MVERALKLPKRLSPSAINTFIKCPQNYKFSYIDYLWGPSNEHLVRGNFVHAILGDLLREKPSERTLERARAIAKEQWVKEWKREAEKVLSGEATIREFQWSSWFAVENYFKLEDPAEVPASGLETQLFGKINGVTIKGFVDRWDAVGDDEMDVIDYKTGKTPKKREWAADYALQMDIYAALLEEKVDRKARNLVLLYLKEGDSLEFEATPTRRESTIATVTNAWEGIVERCGTGEFETKPSKLCDWCNHKEYCPAWQT